MISLERRIVKYRDIIRYIVTRIITKLNRAYLTFFQFDDFSNLFKLNVNKNYFHFASLYLPLYLYFTWHPTGRFSNNENKFLAVLCFDVTYRCPFQTDTLFAKCGTVPGGCLLNFFEKFVFHLFRFDCVHRRNTLYITTTPYSQFVPRQTIYLFEQGEGGGLLLSFDHFSLPRFPFLPYTNLQSKCLSIIPSLGREKNFFFKNVFHFFKKKKMAEVLKPSDETMSR